MTVVHAMFVIERTYRASPARVFAAWATLDAKGRWFGGPPAGDRQHHALDFRVGGREENGGETGDGHTYRFDALYFDIIAGERIIYAYEMSIDGRRISASVGTVEFDPAGAGTRMKYTEQGAYLDGADTPGQRERGTARLFDALGRSLEEPVRD